jgi:hypothetical protein
MNLIESMYAKITGWDPRSWSTPDGRRFRQAWQADDHMDTLDPGGNIDGVKYDPRATNYKVGTEVFPVTDSPDWGQGRITEKIGFNTYGVKVPGEYYVVRVMTGADFASFEVVAVNRFKQLLGL